MTTEALRDRTGSQLGEIETLDHGDQVLRDANGNVRGYYDVRGDFTRDAGQNIVAKGNKLRSMIC
jgi:hypothetical protein